MTLHLQRVLVTGVLLSCVSHSLLFVTADFGDTVDPTYDCPAFTTCSVICVADLEMCPTSCNNDNDNDDNGKQLVLCQDGHCREDCSESFSNPCQDKYADCAAYACAKVDDTVDSCEALYGSYYYEAQETCGSRQAVVVQAQEDSATFSEAPFVVWGVWISFVSIAMLTWCACNQRWNYGNCSTLSRSTSTMPMEDGQYQTGYREHLFGTILYWCVVVTIWGFQVIMLLLVILYYVNQGATPIKIQAIWQDERQVLLAFEVVWMVGFVWNLALKWPAHLRSLFWRRSYLDGATHVAVWTPNELPHGLVASDKYVSVLRRMVSRIQRSLNHFMALLFSEDTSLGNGQWTFCEVKVDADGFSKHFVHTFRQYNLRGDEFLPGKLKNYNDTIGDLDKARSGLTSEDVQARRRVVGPNTIQMPKPTFWGVFFQEFTQAYYTYQNYIMWTWMPLWYYYMAVVQTLVIVTGGLTVCIFRFRNETSLYQLTDMEGDVNVLRDSRFCSVPQADLVPGDVVVVEPGRTYCDMVLVSSAGILVDESALTGESTPVAKTAIDPAEANETYGSKSGHKRHTIQAGTTVLESETGHNLAVVTMTGSFTTKGELLHDIFSYQRHQFKFDVEVAVVVMILIFYAIFSFCAVFYFLQYTYVHAC
jgi:hypothetical protein